MLGISIRKSPVKSGPAQGTHSGDNALEVSDAGGEKVQAAAGHMLLDLQHVSKIYGDLHAVDDLSLTVPAGEWLAIVGLSGSGKTTLMNIIGCMDTPSKGSVTLQGRKLEDLTSSQLADVRKNVIGLCSRSSTWSHTSPPWKTSWLPSTTTR